MKASDYRREYAAYHGAAGRAAHEQFSGRDAEAQLARAGERFADLWTREAVADLEREYDDAPAGFETERAALAALTNAARLGYAEARAREATAELAACESAARVAWDGARLGLDEVPPLVAAEPDAPRRRELASRRLDALRPCDDLRAARLDALADAARELGFADFGALLAEATRADFAQLSDAAGALLEFTARGYALHLSRWAARELPPAFAPGFADALRLARLAQFDAFFPARAARETHDAALAGIGVRVGRLTNLRVEESPQSRPGEVRCFGVRPPEDVRLAHAPRAGADFCLRFFQEAGRAQHLAWASPELAARYPEFVHAPGRAVGDGFGFLFRHLFTDAAWLAERRGARASEAAEIARGCALAELHDARRACALLHSQLELYRAGAARSESLAADYAARQGEATGFDTPAGLHLADALGEGFRAAELLRARLFAASFAEHLRTRHGTRWWASRAAGDELIDVWNTASRHTPEELAWLAAGVRFDPELLAHQLSAALGAG